MDEAEAFLGDGGTGADDEKLTERRLEACEVIPAHFLLQ